MENDHKTFPKTKTVQRDTPSINQILLSSAGKQMIFEGYLDDDIKAIGKFHRRFVDLTDLDDLKQHVSNLSRDIEIRAKEIKEQQAIEASKIVPTNEPTEGE